MPTDRQAGRQASPYTFSVFSSYTHLTATQRGPTRLQVHQTALWLYDVI
jgi:hypothetical protein